MGRCRCFDDHDVCGPGTFAIFKKQFGENAKVWDRDKVVIIPHHFIFTKDTHANRNIDILRQFVKEQDLPHYYDVGTDNYKGVCHLALAQEGFNRPGEVFFGEPIPIFPTSGLLVCSQPELVTRMLHLFWDRKALG
ncbi:MAG: hypothetical protein Ct9H300mP23_00090 [Nitrospinota bacterium]|nr:MAG: hypothetical protein Ct9H300mP23_00090 [Nitrospinota bacterium]